VKYIALVPVKSLDEAKSRLATHLTSEQRANLMLDMLHHVLLTLQSSHIFEHVSVVSADKHVLQHAQSWGACPLIEETAGHNPALTTAATHELQQGATALLTISADLPLLQVADIQHLFDKSKHSDVVIAPSQDGSGTNALLTRPPLILPYRFGINSRYHHQSEAESRHLIHTCYRSIGLALDIDTIDDITAFQQYNESSTTCYTSCFSNQQFSIQQP
jgi:2-phospho-L-lactate/phosphoenolpyruvate guanylyltransferase